MPEALDTFEKAMAEMRRLFSEKVPEMTIQVAVQVMKLLDGDAPEEEMADGAGI